MFFRPLEDFHLVEQAANPTELIPLSPESFKRFLTRTSPQEKAWLAENFTTTPDDHAYKVNGGGRIARAYVAVSDDFTDGYVVPTLYDNAFMLAEWARDLSAGTYALTNKLRFKPEQTHGLTMGWGLGAYAFTKYKTNQRPKQVYLKIPKGVDVARLYRELGATAFVQDLIRVRTHWIN